ncbi:hypothetical protein MPER_12205 [Moniliophthora perniciosa FA553]|nr:hypothetical protein MPER_12205 [Moniliophthora perniciosa FA553]
MDSDPRRRFVFGLKVDYMGARLCFADRLGLLISTPFDIYSDWRILVRILAALGTGARSDLGYDTTMCLHEIRDDSHIFNISVGDKTFRTGEIIHREFDSDPPPRVWVAREVKDGVEIGPNHRLKDHWVRASSEPEHETLAKIKTRLEGDARYAHFPNVCAAGVVPRSTSDLGIPDSTIDDSQLAFEPPIEPPIEGEFRLVHYRIVYEELGEPLPKVKTLDGMLFGLQGALCGIGALHEAGYIHRNIQPENIIFVSRKENAMCRSSDVCPGALDGLVPVIINFEHAVKVDDPQTQNVFRTDHHGFMSSEVIMERWDLPSSMQKPPPHPDFRIEMPHFRQHTFHDFDPILWSAMWLFFRFQVPEAKVNDMKAYKRSYYSLFLPAEKGLPEIYYKATLAFWRWCYDVHIRLPEETYPELELERGMPISDLAKWSPEMVRVGFLYLQVFRDVIAANPALQEKVESFTFTPSADDLASVSPPPMRVVSYVECRMDD